MANSSDLYKKYKRLFILFGWLTYVTVSSSVVSDASLPCEVVKGASAEQNVHVPGLVVVADPFLGHSPECFPVWIISDS